MYKTNKLKAGLLAAVVGVVSPLAMIAPASAADVSWGGIGDQAHVDPFDDERVDNFSDVANWIGGSVVPGAGDTAIFSVNGLSQNVNVDAAVSLAKIVFSGDNDFESSKSYTLSGEAVTITEAIEAMMEGAGGEHQVLSSVTLGDDVTFMTDGVDTLTVGDDETVLDLDGNNLTVEAGGGTVTLQGLIDGEGGITVSEGKLNMLAAPAEGFDATVTVSGGEFVVSENANGDNIVIDGGALRGDTGEEGLLGTVTLNSGSIMPGTSPGCINTTELVLAGGTYEVELNGETICTEYDSVNVTNDIDLGEGEVSLDIERLESFSPEVDTKFAIITYEEDADVTGYFEGWEDGDSNTIDEYTYEINYDDDEAVTLTVLGTPSTPDTGVGSLISNPLVTLAAAGAVLASLGAVRYAEAKKSRS